VDAHKFTKKPKKFKQTLSACHKADGNCFLGEERSADGGIHATNDHNNVRSTLRNNKKLRRAIQNKRRGMLTCGVHVLLLDDNACTNTAARTRALLEHSNWELFDHSSNSPNLAPSDYHRFTCLRSQHFNNNKELMVGVKTWLSSEAADFFDTGIHKLIPRYERCLTSGDDHVEK
jgi:hypothetical protein